MTRKYLFICVSTKNDIDRLQIDLINLGKWSREWLMLFNIDKCKVMIKSNVNGLNNVKAKYEMNGKYLEEVIEERDLGFIIQSVFKCLKAVSAANKVLGMIKRSFSIRDKEIILQ